MKKKLFLTLTTLSLFTSLNTFANSDCPDGNKVKAMALTQATLLGQHRWSLLSDSFKQDHRYWNVFFIVELPEAKTREEALKQGRDHFNQAVIVNSMPTPYNSDGMTYCDYTRNAQYTIQAASAVEDGLSYL